MKDRMKRLLILSLTVTMCVGNILVKAESAYVETESEIATAILEQENESTASEEASKAEATEESEEAPTEEEATEESEEALTEEEATEESEVASTEEEPTEESEEASKEEETTGVSEDASEQEKETLASQESEPLIAKKGCIVKTEEGAVVTKSQIQTPETLTVGSESYPVDYRQGVYKLTVPEGTKKLQIEISDCTDEEILFLTKWKGYLIEQEKIWYLCMDEPMQEAYAIQETTYEVNLEQYALSLQEITKEQLAVYGELAEDVEYAEILLFSEERCELLLIEYACEKESIEEEQIENDVEKDEMTEIEIDVEMNEEIVWDETIEQLALEEDTGIAVYAASESEINSVYSSTGKNLATSAQQYIPTVSSINGEWHILGLARSGQEVNEDVYTQYLANVTQTLIDKNGVLHKKKYTDYSRVILALTSLGCDVTNVAGYNLLQPLSDYDQTVWQGVNGAIWALIAMDSNHYEFPTAQEGKTQNSREKMIQNILDQEVAGGGWDLSGNSADPDVTAMAIQSLAPYYDTDEEVKNAVDRGIAKLSAIQKKNGSYATYGSETSESCSQVIVALTAMGIDPNTDSRFVKNGNSVLDALLTYANADGSFKHILSGSADQMATEQAYYALTAYERFIGGKTRLYDMTDVFSSDEPEKNPESDSTINGTENKDSDNTGSETENKAPDNTGSETENKAPDNTGSETENKAPDNTGSGTENKEPNNTGSDAEDKESDNAEANPEDTKTDTDENNSQTETQKKPSGSTFQVNLVSGNKKGSTSTGSSSSTGGSISSTILTGASTIEKTSEDDKKIEASEEMGVTDAKKGSTKTDKEVSSLISEINRLFRKTKTAEQLPEDAADYSDEQKQNILNIYRTYIGFSTEQKKEVETSKIYASYEAVLEKCKVANHYDAETGIDLRENEEETLPWYVQIEAENLTEEEKLETTIKEVLKENGELLKCMKISLNNLLQNMEWQPEEWVRVSIPMIDLGAYDHVAVIHVKEDGSIEFLEAHIAGSDLEFDTDHFSKFGIVGYNGSMEDLMQEKKEKAFEPYMLPGMGAVILLAFLMVFRMVGKKDKLRKGHDSQ